MNNRSFVVACSAVMSAGLIGYGQAAAPASSGRSGPGSSAETGGARTAVRARTAPAPGQRTAHDRDLRGRRACPAQPLLRLVPQRESQVRQRPARRRRPQADPRQPRHRETPRPRRHLGARRPQDARRHDASGRRAAAGSRHLQVDDSRGSRTSWIAPRPPTRRPPDCTASIAPSTPTSSATCWGSTSTRASTCRTTTRRTASTTSRAPWGFPRRWSRPTSRRQEKSAVWPWASRRRRRWSSTARRKTRRRTTTSKDCRLAPAAGCCVSHVFPSDGEYTVTVTPIFGDNMSPTGFGSVPCEKLLVLLDSERLELLDWQGGGRFGVDAAQLRRRGRGGRGRGAAAGADGAAGQQVLRPVRAVPGLGMAPRRQPAVRAALPVLRRQPEPAGGRCRGGRAWRDAEDDGPLQDDGGTAYGGRDVPADEFRAAARSRPAFHARHAANRADAGLHVLSACRHGPHRRSVQRRTRQGLAEPPQDFRLHADGRRRRNGLRAQDHHQPRQARLPPSGRRRRRQHADGLLSGRQEGRHLRRRHRDGARARPRLAEVHLPDRSRAGRARGRAVLSPERSRSRLASVVLPLEHDSRRRAARRSPARDV